MNGVKNPKITRGKSEIRHPLMGNVTIVTVGGTMHVIAQRDDIVQFQEGDTIVEGIIVDHIVITIIGDIPVQEVHVREATEEDIVEGEDTVEVAVIQKIAKIVEEVGVVKVIVHIEVIIQEIVVIIVMIIKKMTKIIRSKKMIMK